MDAIWIVQRLSMTDDGSRIFRAEGFNIATQSYFYWLVTSVSNRSYDLSAAVITKEARRALGLDQLPNAEQDN